MGIKLDVPSFWEECGKRGFTESCPRCGFAVEVDSTQFAHFGGVLQKNVSMGGTSLSLRLEEPVEMGWKMVD